MCRIFVFMMVFFSVSGKAQTTLRASNIYPLQQQSFIGNSQPKDSIPAKKWFVSKSVGISTSVGFFNGGNTTVMTIPVSIQLNRRLNNNWYAFAGVSAAPAYINFNGSYLSGNPNKFSQPYNFGKSNRLDIYSRAEMGLMYINDQKTFSISGSIGIEKSSYPLLPFNQIGSVRPNAYIAPNRY